MPRSQSAIHLLVPSEANARMLYPGRVLQTSSDEMLVEFDRAIVPEVGTDVNIFFDVNGKFMQQGARIVAIQEPLPSIVSCEAESEAEAAGDSIEFVPVQAATIKCIGAPVSAESRGSYRVSVVGLELFARIENERRCQIVDLSPEGLAITSMKNHRLGTLLRIVFDAGGEEQDGRVRVQTVRELPSGKFRCGLLVPSVEKKIRAALQRMTSWAQRLQLQRIRKSA